MSETVNIARLDSSEDLIPDRALREREDDAFNHEVIAANLAAHVATAETRLNIALYGPWGSGKSSAFELLRRHLEVEGRSVKLVHYDASRYGGESLRRNFISHAANELGFGDRKKHRSFHGGLYEGRASSAVELPEALSDWRKVGAPVFTLAATLVGILMLVAVVGLGVSYLTDKSPLNQVSAFLVGLAVPAGVAALIVATAKAVLDGASITREQSQPSADEEFRRRFGQLVDAAREKHEIDRIVFFIDELDRCSPPDVVETLKSIRTFLDHDNCVFVVAADREVLEEALTTHLQPTPLNEDHPYYSSASSYLDKVFHHQLFLPPLRTMKLTHFARELVSERGGLWREFRDAVGQRSLDRVIYALVPSHVVSPRRVKVLLNNFASNVRVIESRGIDWKGRAPEIAKLSVLQTEFPALAADLPHEPRLPEMLLEPPSEPPERLRRLLERHGVVYDAARGESKPAAADAASSEPPATDPLLPTGRDVDPAARQQVISVQHRDLRRYLKRTSGVGIPSPGRDLLYLESVGELHGLEDIALSEAIEGDATEAPDALIEKLTERDYDEKIVAVRILCDISEGEFGEERANVITALLGIVEQLGSEIDEVASRVVESLRSFQAEQNLDEHHLVGALQLTLALDTPEARGLRQEVIGDARLFADPDRSRRAALMLDRMDDDLATIVSAQVAERLATDPSTLLDPLRELPTDTAVDLMERAAIDNAVKERHNELAETDLPAAENFVEDLYQAVEARSDGQAELLDALQWLLLHNRIAYSSARRHAEAAMAEMLAGDVRDSHAFMGLRMGGVSDWDFWTPYLGDQPRGEVLTWLAAVISHVGTDLLKHADSPAARRTARALAPHAADLEDELRAEITNALEAALSQRTWWAVESEAAAQKDVYDVALDLAGVPGTQLRREVDAALRRDVLRVMERPAPPQPGPNPVATVTAQRGLRVLGAMLPEDDRLELIGNSRALLSTGDSALDGEVVRTVLALAASVPGPIDVAILGETDTLVAALPTGAAGAAAAGDWLALDPPPGTVAALAKHLWRRPSSDLAQRLDAWAERQDDAARTATLSHLLDVALVHLEWVRRIAAYDIDDLFVVEAASQRVQAASRARDRERLIDFVLAVSPSSSRAHGTVAQLMLWLLKRDTKVDFDLALRTAPALGTDHRHGEKLRSAFERAADKNGFRIPPKALTHLHAAKVRPKQKTVADSALGLFRSFWGGGTRR